MILVIILRCTIIYLIVLLLLRIMGKRQIGELQPFELVITLIIADLATIPIGETSIPLLHGIIPLFTLAVLHYAISLITRKSTFMRRVVNGSPVIIIDQDGVNYSALKSLNMNFNDLLESLHTSGYFSLEEVMYAIVQSNGKLSVLPKSQHAPLTPNEMQISTPKSTLPLIVLSEGKVQENNLKLAKLDEEFLQTNIVLNGFKTFKEIALITLTQDGKLYVQPQKGKYKLIKTNYKGEQNW